ncbi:cytochrome P450 [Nocardia sp. IFM 10818]
MSRTLPLLGDTIPLLRDPIGFLSSLPERGRLVWIRLGPVPVAVLCDPELTRIVLRDDGTFDKGGPFFDRLRDLFGDGLGTCPHAEHRRLRRLVQPAFRPGQLRRYDEVMRDEARRMSESWCDGQVLDVTGETMSYTARIALRTLFSASLTEELLDGAITDLDDFVAGVPRRMLMPHTLARLPLPGNRRYQRTITRLRATIDEIIAERRRRPITVGEPDLLASMIIANDSDSGGLTDTELTDQATTFLATGTETSSTTLAWALYLLARHPHIQKQLHVAARTAAPTGATSPGEDDSELFRHVIDETLRLYPPPWLLTRRVTTDTVLDGHRLPAGTIVAYSAYLTQRNSAYYPDPDAFDPGRWHGTDPRPGTYLPFGDGPRGCIGGRFAAKELIAALEAVTARWHLTPLTDRPQRPRIGTTVSPHGLRLRVTALG